MRTLVRGMVALLGAGLLSLAAAAPALADADSVLVRVGGDVSSRQGSYVDVPVTVDLSGAPGRQLGSYRAKLSFNPAILQFQQANAGNFAAPSVNTVHASDSGQVLLTAVMPGGASGVVTIFVARFYVVSDTAQSPISVSFDEMSATALSVTPFESLLPLLRYINGTFCRSLGRWGDVDGDGLSNSRDALIALSAVVGMAPDTVVYDTVSTEPLTVDTTVTMRPSLADVDADGKVTSRDALIILSYAVGLPVSGYRVLLPAAGACATGAAITLVIAPDSIELQAGQGAKVLATAHDANARSVPTDGLTWVSSNPSVAVYDPNSGQVVARGAGVTTLTAQLGPGVTGALKVSVLARRTTWYVAVERARNAPTQLGTQAWPLEFIGDALSVAHDGDTVRVAGGIYEEVVSANVAVVLIGDPANPPVLDPRGAPNWSPGNYVLDLEPETGLLRVANFDIKAGRVYLDAHDFAVRNVLIEGLGGSTGRGLQLYSENFTPSTAPRPSGPMRSNAPTAPGNVLIDGVTVSGDAFSTGIEVDLADSVEIKNSSVTRTNPGTYAYCGTGPNVDGGIVVQQASVSRVHDNVVTNPACQGIGVFDDLSTSVVDDIGRATISRNHVTNAPGTGIGAGARVVALDHNVVQGTGLGLGSTSGATVGIHITTISCECSSNGQAPDTVTSLGDTASNSGGRGFAIDTTAAATIDSLVIAGTGQDGSYNKSYGVDLENGGHFSLSHSHISNTLGDNAVNVVGDKTVISTRGNRIQGAGFNGISAWYPTGSICGNGCSPIARSGPARGPLAGPYSGGPDTLVSVADTILNSSGAGIYSANGVYTLVDSAVVDTSGNEGIDLESLGRATVRNSVVRRSADGINAYQVDSLSVLRDTVDANAYDGVYVESTVDSATIRGTVASSNPEAGVYLYNATARIDSSVAVDNGTGIYLDYGGAARVRWATFQANNIGMLMGSQTFYTGSSSSVVNSSFLGDTTAGARNDGFNGESGPILSADTNYWGDPNGPRCGLNVGGCNEAPPSVSGDSIASLGVTFQNWLTSPPLTSPPPAPPFRRVFAAATLGARKMATSAALATGAQAHGHGSAARGRGARPAQAAVRAAPAAARAAAAPRPQHQQPEAWHAPSKVRAYSVVRASVKRP